MIPSWLWGSVLAAVLFVGLLGTCAGEDWLGRAVVAVVAFLGGLAVSEWVRRHSPPKWKA